MSVKSISDINFELKCQRNTKISTHPLNVFLVVSPPQVSAGGPLHYKIASDVTDEAALKFRSDCVTFTTG